MGRWKPPTVITRVYLIARFVGRRMLSDAGTLDPTYVELICALIPLKKILWKN